MSKVITFSRTYPSYHPKAGQPTYFVEKVQGSLYHQRVDLSAYLKDPDMFMRNNWFDKTPKHHTVRAGHRWKAGDWFSPRVWSGKPYRSKMIQFAPDIQVKKTWDFEMKMVRVNGQLDLHGFVNRNLIDGPKRPALIAANDGLELQDFTDWFCKKGQKFIVGLPIFDGQIIAWNESIEY